MITAEVVQAATDLGRVLNVAASVFTPDQLEREQKTAIHHAEKTPAGILTTRGIEQLTAHLWDAIETQVLS